VVVLLLTEANLSRFGFGMQQAYLKKGLKWVKVQPSVQFWHWVLPSLFDRGFCRR
jgi:hypothetical protein